MDTSGSRNDDGAPQGALTFLAPEEAAAGQPLAWEEIENGRYMPRRVRGSCRGRELG